MDVIGSAILGVAFPLAVWAILRARIREIGLLTVTGTLLWVTGAGLVLSDALQRTNVFPSLGHLAWMTALPVLVVGLFASKGAHRLYVGPLMIFDVLLVSVTWLMLIWKACIWNRELTSFTDIPWLTLTVMLSELAVFALVSQLASNLPQAAMVAMAFGAALTIGSDVALLLRLGGGGEGLELVRLVLLPAGIAVCILSVGVNPVPSDRTEAELQHRGRLRGSVTIALAAIPLTLYIFTMAGGPADAGSLVLSGLLVAVFSGREVYRARQNRSLVAALAAQAVQDPLTGLPNRRGLEEELRYRGGPDSIVSVLAIDVDRFKEVNRELGHLVGDRVLKTVADVLLARPEVTGARAAACRLGGDEFALVACMDEPEATALAERIRIDVGEAIAAIAGVAPLSISLSIGLATSFPDERRRAPFAVLNRSTQALRAAKDERNVVRFFSDDDALHASEQARLEKRLRAAVVEERIGFVYEPIVELASGRVVSLEALARWHEDGVDVPPTVFIALAERVGLVHEISWQGFQHSIRLRSMLRDAGIALSVSVNVSPVQLRRPSFQPELFALLAEHDVPPSDLTVEVTEGVFIDVDDSAVTALYRLHDEGVRIALDDFGTGYSSLGYMSRLPAHVIKLDKSLVSRIDAPQSRAIVQAMLDVAAAHQVSVVMEGVETIATCRQLVDMGAAYGQGWLFSKGQSAEDVPAMLDRLGIGSADPGPGSPHVPAGQR